MQYFNFTNEISLFNLNFYLICSSALLCSKDAFYIRFGQAETLYVVIENVLRKWSRYWRVPIQTHKSDLETIQKETEPQKC